MDAVIIQGMVHVLKPVLKDRARAERILTRYWQNRMALVWLVEDVHRAANERDLALSDGDAMQVLQTLHLNYNPQLGIRWEDITAHITEHVLGRKLTKREIHQFVHHDRLTIQR